jgi:disulfide bond formation protein DsbB
MTLFTMSPWVLLILILALLLIILLAAFSRKIAENILWFFGGVLDLYQRWRQLLIHAQPAPSSEQKLNDDAPQHHSTSTEQTPAASDTAYVLSTLQPQAALQQRQKVSDTMGERQ